MQGEWINGSFSKVFGNIHHQKRYQSLYAVYHSRIVNWRIVCANSSFLRCPWLGWIHTPNQIHQQSNVSLIAGMIIGEGHIHGYIQCIMMGGERTGSSSAWDGFAAPGIYFQRSMLRYSRMVFINVRFTNTSLPAGLMMRSGIVLTVFELGWLLHQRFGLPFTTGTVWAIWWERSILLRANFVSPVLVMNISLQPMISPMSSNF